MITLHSKCLFLVFPFLFLSSKAIAQDSLVYSQKDAQLFSNSYTFFPDGTFKHFYLTDDGQVWYGKGNYFDDGKYRTLYFREADTTMKRYEGWKVYYETNFQRVLVRKKKGYKSYERNGNTGKPGVELVVGS